MKKIHKKVPSKHTLFQFIHVVPWENIEMTMNKREYKKFVKFMSGQTVRVIEGKAWVYVGDLSRFLADTNNDELYD